ncbi:hypothetical protein [Clostridium botulinum]|nr:hypothetical protein [Clostridium botulinum]
MYYLFKHKNILPSDFYLIKHGEKKILHAFVNQEIDDRNNSENFV